MERTLRGPQEGLAGQHQTQLKRELLTSQAAQIQPPKLAPSNKDIIFFGCRTQPCVLTINHNNNSDATFPRPGKAPGFPEWPHCALPTEEMQFVLGQRKLIFTEKVLQQHG